MDTLISRIKEQKKFLGHKIAILAHHYQNMDIVNLADITGDSYKLAVEGSRSSADFLVFCGVKFMAEGASILAGEKQKVLLPDLQAGCPLAEMISTESAEEVFNRLKEAGKDVVPVVYVNSNADIKHFCGERGGATCTSSNAKNILEWYFSQGKSVFFFPDYNLGINTSRILKLKEEEIVKVKRNLSFQGDVEKGKLFLWDGFCIVHKAFNTADILKLREEYKGINIIVHPECDEEVVNMSDFSGSTEKILNTVRDGKAGSIWGIGTEYNFVSRLAKECTDKTVVPLKESRCRNMEQITLADLEVSLNSVTDYIEGKDSLKYEINVPETYKDYGKSALQNMIDIVEGK